MVLQRAAVAEVEPVPLVGLRLMAGLAFFIPFTPRVWRGLTRNPRRILDVWLLGGINPCLTGVLSALALSLASSGIVAVLNSLAPLLTALLGRFLLSERPLTRSQLAGLGVAFAGVVLLLATGSTGLGPRSGEELAAGSWQAWGGPFLAIVIAAIMALATIYTRRRLTGTDPLAMAAGQISGGLLLAGPAALLVGGPLVLGEISVWTWVAIVASGTIGLGASFWLFLGMVERHGTTAALLALYVMPVAATALGALLLGEQVTPAMAGGTALVLGGVVLFTRG